MFYSVVCYEWTWPIFKESPFHFISICPLWVVTPEQTIMLRIKLLVRAIRAVLSVMVSQWTLLRPTITSLQPSQPLWAEEGRWTDKSQTIWPGPVPSAPLARYLNWQLQTRQTELHQPHLFVELETLREHSSRLNQNCKMLISCQLLEVESCFWNSSYSCKVFPSVGNPQLVLELLFRDKF